MQEGDKQHATAHANRCKDKGDEKDTRHHQHRFHGFILNAGTPV